jgi:hypothetical protein
MAKTFSLNEAIKLMLGGEEEKKRRKTFSI